MPAGDIAARLERFKGWLLLAAFLGGIGTAWMETTSSGRAEQVRRFTG